MSDRGNPLFVFWPGYSRDDDGKERWGAPSITSQPEYAQRWANAGVPVMEYMELGPLQGDI